MNDIESRYSNRGIVRWENTLMLPKDIAIEFVKDCKKDNYTILAIEGFFLKGETTQPSMDNSLDFTNSDYPEYYIQDRYTASINFIKERNEGLYFNVVLDEE